MLNINTIKRKSVNSKLVTRTTSKPISKETLINPYEPFLGTDGRKYEISYKSGLNKTTNCYAFAMGWFTAATDKYVYYIPGFLCKKKFSFDHIPELIQADLETVGRKVYEIVYDIPEKLPEKEGYWVKGVMSKKKGKMPEFHIMRKDPKSGRWIHKMGWEYPPKLVIRNSEFKDKTDVVIEQMKASGINMGGMTREDIIGIAAMMFPKEYYTGVTLTKNEYETDDSAGYIAFTEADEREVFEALWAMRISEP